MSWGKYVDFMIEVEKARKSIELKKTKRASQKGFLELMKRIWVSLRRGKN